MTKSTYYLPGFPDIDKQKDPQQTQKQEAFTICSVKNNRTRYVFRSTDHSNIECFALLLYTAKGYFHGRTFF